MYADTALPVPPVQGHAGVQASPLLADHGHMEYTGSDDERDEDAYGNPSSEEEDNYGHDAYSQPAPPPPDKTRLDDDDAPLGAQALSIQAAHERIIQEEKRAQNDRALLILEGKLPSGSVAVENRTDASEPPSAARVPPIAREKTVRREEQVMSAHKRSSSESFPLRRSGTLMQAPKQLLRSATNKYLRTRSDKHAAEPLPSTIPATLPSTIHHNPTPVSGAEHRTHVSPTAAPRAQPPPYMAHDPAGPSVGMGLPPSHQGVHDATHAMSRMGLRTQAHSYRVFVLNVQRYTVVNLPEEAMIRQMLQATVSQMHLAPCADRVNGWAVFDVLPDLGIGASFFLTQNGLSVSMNASVM